MLREFLSCKKINHRVFQEAHQKNGVPLLFKRIGWMLMDEKSIAIELKGITKLFGSVVANDNVNLTVRSGEILALLGENGSGKTTLMNMLSGIYHQDAGSIKIRGKTVSIRSPKDSFSLGIGMIHQHFKLVEVMGALENILMGTSKKIALSKSKRESSVKELCEKFGLEIDLKKKIRDMSVSEKQTVEILKVLHRGADILILDEPTAVLTPQETEKLFAILRKMCSAGCAIVIITHKLNEVLEISDKVTVLRKGRSVKTLETCKTNANELTELMVGQAVELHIECPKPKKEKHLFEVHHLTVINSEGIKALKDVSFGIDGGEILGVAGVAGSGQKELCEAIAGLQKAKEGAILYKKENIVGKTPAEIIKSGISMSFIPEDRLGMGLVASMDITHNMLLKTYKDGKKVVINRKPAREMAENLVKRLDISTPSISTPVRRLSGGNVQKVLLGREIASNPSLLITAYAVRGLDVNSSYTIYSLLNEQKEKGVAVLYIGEDLDVLLELCDRIMVLFRGQVMGIVSPKSTTKEKLGLMMAGEQPGTEETA